MQAAIKQKWIEALRSGRYEQGTGELCSTHAGGSFQYCCLGVLAEVAGADRAKLIGQDHLGRVNMNHLLGSWGPINERYSSGDPGTHTSMQRKLAAMNDNEEPFTAIADWIEANIPAE